jgi:hypothetical protein
VLFVSLALSDALTSFMQNYWTIYDYPNYCTTYGGGHDIYMDSGCRNGYTSPSSYRSAYQIDSNWLGNAAFVGLPALFSL